MGVAGVSDIGASQKGRAMNLEANRSVPPSRALWVGFSRAVINPSRSVTLEGYKYRKTVLPPGNDGVHDPLYARVLALRDGGPPAVLVSMDLCFLTVAAARDLRKAIVEKCEVDPARVILAATHTHSGPAVVLDADDETGDLPAEAVQESIAYYRQLRKNILQAVVAALAYGHSMQVYVQEVPLGLGYDRRIQTPEGVKNCWSPLDFPDLPLGLSPDPHCTMLLLRQVHGSKRLVLWSVGVHPTTLGRTSRVVSAEYPGAACSMIEEYCPDTSAMFVLGACGHSGPWVSVQDAPAKVELVARPAASMVALLMEAPRPAGGGEKLKIASRTITIGRNELDLAVWRLGPLWLVACPVELFGELSLDLRRRLGGAVMLAAVANGWLGYWPTKAAFDEGAYEAALASEHHLEPGDVERLIDALVELAGPLR